MLLLFRGVNAYVELVKHEGFNHVIQRHYTIRDALRTALTSLELELLVKMIHTPLCDILCA